MPPPVGAGEPTLRLAVLFSTEGLSSGAALLTPCTLKLTVMGWLVWGARPLPPVSRRLIARLRVVLRLVGARPSCLKLRVPSTF